MTVVELKEFIYKENKIEFILDEIGCGHITYHPTKDYYSCSNCNGDNKNAINIIILDLISLPHLVISENSYNFAVCKNSKKSFNA